MTLNPLPIYPTHGGYVLRLHRDSRPADALLVGRIQHMASGDVADFACAQELLDWLMRHAAQSAPPSEGEPR